MAVVFQPKNDGFPVNTRSGIQRERKWNLFGWFERQHRAERKSMLGEVAHHPAIGGRQLHVDKGQGALAELGSAFGLDGHRRSIRRNSNSRTGILGGGSVRKSAKVNRVGRASFQSSAEGKEPGKRNWRQTGRSKRTRGKAASANILELIERREWGHTRAEAGQDRGAKFPSLASLRRSPIETY